MREDVMLGLFITAFIIAIAFGIKTTLHKTYPVTL